MSKKPFFLVLVLLFSSSGICAAESLYKFRGPDGEWIYSDRPPDNGSAAEIRQLRASEADKAVTVTHSFESRAVELVAHNNTFAPVELVVTITSIRGLQFPNSDFELHWKVPARGDMPLFTLNMLEDGSSPSLKYQYQYIAGDPDARHQPSANYRAPFAIASKYPVTQAYPDVRTHGTPNSYYAVDLAMPIGTDIFAAREGIVFDVAASNFRAGLDLERDGPAANVVRILHDDGTYAIYAHLNTNTIRVRPGDRVQRGQYIADSGNTGYSSGPHLHFAVVRNIGMQTLSVPVSFEGANARTVVPSAGMILTAY